jgi:predicted enzyme related to lactoylglutathione lyase
MKNEVIKIELNTEIGTFKFENHFNSAADFYQALLNFESNNWEMLGETSYNVFTKFEDGETTQTLIEGINASAHLAGFMDKETAI